MAITDFASWEDEQTSGLSINVVPGAGRRGGGALHRVDYAVDMHRPGGPIGVIPTGAAFYVAQFAFKPGLDGVWANQGQHIFGFRAATGTPKMCLVTGVDGDLEVWQHYDYAGGTRSMFASYPGVFADPDTYYYIEYKVGFDTGTAGSMRLLVDGVDIANFLSMDVFIDDPALYRPILFDYYYDYASGSAVGPFDMFIDDWIGLDSTGSTNNDFLGDRAVTILKPYGGFSLHLLDWESYPTPGNFAVTVDERPHNSDTDYIVNAAPPAGYYYTTFSENTFFFSHPSSTVIPAIRPIFFAKEDSVSATPTEICMLVMLSLALGFDEWETLNPTFLPVVGDTYDDGRVQTIIEASPFASNIGDPITVSYLGDIAFGPKLVADAPAGIRITMMGMEVINPPAVAAGAVRSWVSVSGF